MLLFMFINVKMPTIVGILTFMSRKNFMLNSVEHEKSFITSGPGPGCSKLTTSLVNVSLKFQMLISQIRPYFCRQNLRSFCTAKASLIFSTKIPVYLVLKS